MLNFNLDLQKQDNFSKAFTARMGDVGEQFSVTLFDNQTPYTPVSGDVVSFRVVTPSGKFASVAGTMSGNKATFTLNGQITSEAGYYQRAYVAVSNGTKLRTTQDLIFFSLGNSDINRGQADYYVAELDKLLQQLNEEFDQWLIDREADYSDLLARIVALTNRVTGLETKLDDIIAQLQKNMISTTNVFDSSLILMPESNVRRRVDGQTIDTRGWGSILVQNANVISMFEPNKTYHTKYVAELLTLTGGTVTQGGQFGLALYSGKADYPTVWLTQMVVPNDMQNMKVGDTLVMEKTFTTPSELHNTDANYQILQYSRRDSTGVVDAVRFHDIMIQEGSMFTGYQNNPDNTLTKYDKDRLKQNLHPDPLMTGTVPIRLKDSALTLTWTTSGWLDVKNTDNNTSRRFWYDPLTDLNIPPANVTRPFSVSLKIQLNNGASIKIGYASGENITYTSTSDTAWVWVTGIIKPISATSLSVYLSPNASLKIQQFDIYYAEITNSSNELNKLPAIAKMTVDSPDSLSGADANTLTSSGLWRISSGVNMPPQAAGNYYYLRVINFNPTNCLQIAYLRLGSTGAQNKQYIRQWINGTWQEWRFVPTVFSDGRVDSIADDFNNLKETMTVVNTSPTNSPTGAASTSWYTEVFRYGTSGNYVYQRTTQISNFNTTTYDRQMYNGTWTSWRQLTDTQSNNNILRVGDASDLNNYTTTQRFAVSSPANAPQTGNIVFYVDVVSYNEKYCKQTATALTTADNTYTRQLVNSVWTPWKLITKV